MCLEGRKSLIEQAPDNEIDRLYAAPLETFVSTRNEIVQRFRELGQTEVADEIAKFKKPSLSAWVVNQLARARELDIQRLLKAGEALEQAQKALLKGNSIDFEMSRKEHAASVRILQKAAKETIPGISPAIVDRVVRTLGSATSAENRELIKRGRLTSDLEPPGFEVFVGAPSKVSAKRGDNKDKAQTADLTARKQAVNKAAAQLSSEALELERIAKALELDAQKARRRAEAARAKANAAAEDLSRITAELDAVTNKG